MHLAYVGRNVVSSGIDGSEKIKEMMYRFRNESMPFDVVKKLDYKDGLDGLPKTNVLKFILPNGWFAVRPSGTEPKIKFYFEIFEDALENAYDDLSDLVKDVLRTINRKGN